MIYFTVKQSPRYHQITLDELLEGINDLSKYVNPMTSNTRTHVVSSINEKRLGQIDVGSLINALKDFNERHSNLFKVERHSLYHSFYIPKKSGGLRRIDAPENELMEALRQLKWIFETQFTALYHTSAFAYICGRSTIDAIKKHQQNESHWFLKLDFTNFFGSTSFDFVVAQLEKIFPFSEVLKKYEGRVELRKALELCFLGNSLPQGTPISPLLTNLIMIPLDHKISNALRNYENQNYVYTRYADDILISSKYNFDQDKLYNFIINVHKEFHTPYVLNPEKTRYGSRSGSNWNLGVMLNKDNKITIGHRKKKQFKAMINNFATDMMNGIEWDRSDIRELCGITNYYKMVESAPINSILDRYSEKFKINIRNLMKDKLK